MRGPMGTVLPCLAFVAAVVLVGGCSDDPPDAGRLPSDSLSPTTSSASPSPSTPEEQIEAAVRAYYAELTRAAQTNDTSRLRTMTTQGCPCFGYVRSIEQGQRRGQRTPDAAWDVESVRVHDLESRSAIAQVEYTVAPYAVLNRSGEVVRRYPEQSGNVDLSLVRNARGWIIGNLFDLES